MTFVNAQAEDSQIFLYKRRYVPVEGHAPCWFLAMPANWNAFTMKVWMM